MSVIQTLLESPVFLICCSILMFWIFDAIAWHWIVPYSTLAINVNAAFKPPSLAHLFGTDNYGRDVFSRVLAGAQSVLSVGGFGALIGVAAGTIVALVAGYYKGVVDGILMRLSNIVLAIPIIVFAAMAAGMLGSSVLTAVIVIGFIFTPIVSRSLRTPVMVESLKSYVTLAKLRGDSDFYIMFVEILTNILGPLVVEATVRFSYDIFLSATLSFLGLGLQPPSPDWGLAIADGRTYIQTAPWIVLFPALALASLVVSVNLVAENIRAAIHSA